ncbi:MAG: thioredoxin family protein [Phycisphaeraceae bacterium]
MSGTATTHPVVSRDEWTAARKALLAKEKSHMRQGDALAAERRALPWVRIEKQYAFETEAGTRTLAELFGGCSQLIVHHLMYAPDWEAACPGCSFQAEHIDGPARHLQHHNVRIVAVSRAPIDKLLAYRKRMGWRFEWASSFGGNFNYDFHVSFTSEQLAKGAVNYNLGTIETDPRYQSEELPGVSIFFKDTAGQVFHTYSAYARGLDMLLGADHYLDLTPEGRNEAAYPDWPRRHDEYEGGDDARSCCAS